MQRHGDARAGPGIFGKIGGGCRVAKSARPGGEREAHARRIDQVATSHRPVAEDRIVGRTDFGRAIGLLYGCNTLGAVVGALIGEAYLVAAFGIRGTSVAAAAASCIAAAIALLVARIDSDNARAIAEPTLPLRLVDRACRVRCDDPAFLAAMALYAVLAGLTGRRRRPRVSLAG